MSAERFIQLAERGSHRGASGGEKACNRLAKALAEIGDDLALLDSATIEGACQVIRRMAGPWRTDEEKAVIFYAVCKAAGQ